MHDEGGRAGGRRYTHLLEAEQLVKLAHDLVPERRVARRAIKVWGCRHAGGVIIYQVVQS